MKVKVKASIYMFLIGFIGVLSLLLNPLSLDMLPNETRDLILSKFTETELRFLNLINPTILLLITSILGGFLYKKVGLKSLILSYLFEKNKDLNIKKVFMDSFLFSLCIVVVISLIYLFIEDHSSFQKLKDTKLETNFLVKILYGGITEEIMVRWGLMSFIVYLSLFVIKNKYAYYIGIFLSSILFGMGHLPIIFQLLGDDMNTFILLYIVFMNFIPGLVFGYLFWKRDIETSIVTHIFFHCWVLLITCVITI